MLSSRRRVSSETTTTRSHRAYKQPVSARASQTLRVAGSTMGTREEFLDLLAYLEREGISPRIGAELPLEDAAEGVKTMLEGRTAGKVVFTR